jgi:hypothetical protein
MRLIDHWGRLWKVDFGLVAGAVALATAADWLGVNAGVWIAGLLLIAGIALAGLLVVAFAIDVIAMSWWSLRGDPRDGRERRRR